jgi:glycosyltransferase involved in cell wall biosynthesis
MSSTHKKSVLVLAHSAAIGGAELALASLMESTQDQYAWHIVFADTKKAAEKLKAPATQITYLDLPWWCYEARGKPKKVYKKALLNSIAKLKSLACDADILLSNTLTVPWLGLLAGEIRKPHIWYVHEFGDVDHHYHFVAGYDESLALVGQNAQRVLTISNAVKQHLARIIPEANIDIIHQAVNAENLTQLPVANVADPIRLLALGGIKPSKGQHIALEAAQQCSNIFLDIVGPSGDDNYVERLHQSTASAKNVSLQVRAYDVAQELVSHDVVLMCSQNEALGRVTLEALAAGKRVIGYACTATKELLADGRGILYTPNTPQALASALKNALPHFCPDIEKNRQYVIETYGPKKQAADFYACVSKAFASPACVKPSSVETYLSTLEAQSLFVGLAGHIKQQSRRVAVESIPLRVRKSLKKFLKAMKPSCYVTSTEN